ncbi:MAG: hypothetical protein FJY20_03240 [Bacteroidetes bacterium]|nr:hypothetical protein [Bacteroidota bacterium]
MRKNITLSFCILLFTVTTAKTQNNPTSAEKVKVFLDCTREWLCDFDYVKQEMKMVDLVRDRFLADVHVQVVTNFVSGGGEQNQVIFIGQKKFASRNDTLSYFNNPTMTDDEKRKQLVKYLEIGLFPFYTKTAVADNISIVYNAKETENDATKTQQKKDPWNFWQLSFGGSGFFNGDQNYKSRRLPGEIGGSRETNKSRSNINFSIENNKTTFSINDSTKDVAENKVTSFNANHAIKLNEHWAIGGNLNYQRSIFEN